MSSIVRIFVLADGNLHQKSLLLQSERNYYLINCSEGTVRTLEEHRFLKNKLQHIFLTRLSTENCGGIIGLQKTLHSTINQLAVIHGPPGAADFMEQITNALREDGDSKVRTITPTENGVDGNLTVKTFQVCVDSADHTDSKRARYDDDTGDISFGYHFILKPLARKFNKDALKKAQLPKYVLNSNLMQKLQVGETIELTDGRVVHGTDLLDIPKVNRSFIVLESSSPEMAEAFIEQSELMTAVEGRDDVMVDLVFHLVSQNIANHSSFFKLLETLQKRSCQKSDRCSPLTQVIVNGSSKRSLLGKIYHMRSVFHRYVDKTCFPLLDGQQIEQEPTPSKADTPEAFMPEKISNCYLAESMLMYELRPNVGFSMNHLVDIGFERGNEYLMEFYANEAIFKEAMTDLNKAMTEARKQLPTVIREYPKVTFLGTGAACSSKYRNVSSILLEVSDSCCILMDCGEGTTQQLRRLHNQTEYERILKSVQLVLVSHLHSDHCHGLPGLLLARHAAFLSAGLAESPVLNIMAPYGLLTHIRKYLLSCRSVVQPNYFVFGTNSFCQMDNKLDESVTWFDNFKELQLKLNVSIRPVSVPHSKWSLGFVVTYPHSTADKFSTQPVENEWKIVYSGDCRPNDNLVMCGMNCDLLIHEATFSSDQQSMAISKKHSTVDEAILQGKLMNAQFTLLTHFSQRFSKIPFVLQKVDNVAFAYDHMTVDMDTMQILPVITPWAKYLAPREWIQYLEEETRELSEEVQTFKRILK